MPRRITLFSLVVLDYYEAKAFFLSISFTCREDTPLSSGKRWLRVAPKDGETEILLAKAKGNRQVEVIGN